MNGFISNVGSLLAVFFSLGTGFLTGASMDLSPSRTLWSLERNIIRVDSVAWLKTEYRTAFAEPKPQPDLDLKLTASDPLQTERSPAGFEALYSSSNHVIYSEALKKSFSTRDLGVQTQKTQIPLLATGTASDRTMDSSHQLGSTPPNPGVGNSGLAEVEAESIHFSPNLSESEKSKLTALFLEEQMKRSIHASAGLGTKAVSAQGSKNMIPAPKPITLAQSQRRATEYAKAMASQQPQEETIEPSSLGGCGLGVDHVFASPGKDQPICPKKLSWISKSWNSKGWIKVEGASHFPTLTRQPAPSKGPTLLLDEGQIAALFIGKGLQPTKGMGMVLGRLPEGYKVEFAGRSEETEYFEWKGQKYFAILNVEPGAGVIELVSDRSPDQNATNFVPVLEDVTTYLDLSAPEAVELAVRVVKNGTSSDSEVVGLTVGLSTQSGIQAITKSDGTATLKQVRTVPGFPIFVDIGSRRGEESGYVYRFELSEMDQTGRYLVNQIEEKSLYRWLNQVQQGLSDQGAMVVGSYDRSRFDGFRDEYHAEVEPLTAKFGLEPLNYSVLWNGEISKEEALEGDLPRFMSVQVSEGLSQVKLNGPGGKIMKSDLIPVSPRVIHVVSP